MRKRRKPHNVLLALKKEGRRKEERITTTREQKGHIVHYSVTTTWYIAPQPQCVCRVPTYLGGKQGEDEWDKEERHLDQEHRIYKGELPPTDHTLEPHHTYTAPAVVAWALIAAVAVCVCVYVFVLVKEGGVGQKDGSVARVLRCDIVECPTMYKGRHPLRHVNITVNVHLAGMDGAYDDGDDLYEEEEEVEELLICGDEEHEHVS